MSIISDVTVPARAPYSATLKAGQVMRLGIEGLGEQRQKTVQA